ncbi:MAG TPA: DinB family protein [Flavobacterium sp.]|nr:DinB family protein [Flavobacterium sp.]
MKSFFKELFEYTCNFNDKVIDSLLDGAGAGPEKSLQLISHTLNAQEIWNARIEERLPTVGVWDIRPVGALKNINKVNYENSLRIVEEYDFDKIIRYTTSKGEAFENSVRDILFHVINHSTYHRGQIATDCKLHGMTPLVTDYIFYKRDVYN